MRGFFVNRFHAVIQFEEVQFVFDREVVIKKEEDLLTTVEKLVCKTVVLRLQQMLSATQSLKLNRGPSRVLHDDIVIVFVFNFLLKHSPSPLVIVFRLLQSVDGLGNTFSMQIVFFLVQKRN
jgi:hypothetical protein